jgi:hypothetical protein
MNHFFSDLADIQIVSTIERFAEQIQELFIANNQCYLTKEIPHPDLSQRRGKTPFFGKAVVGITQKPSVTLILPFPKFLLITEGRKSL